jgi:hypothetical protein
MKSYLGFGRLGAAMMFGFLAILAFAGQPALAAKIYVDRTLGDVAATDKVSLQEKRPVQLIFEFRTKGAANAKATKYLKDIVEKKLTESGYFSSVSTAPVEGGATLIMVIDNIPEEGAAGKGFKVGLTFGLAGTKVTDFYDSSLEYSAGGGAGSTKSSVKHAIHTTLGKKADESIGILVKKYDDAFDIVVRQIVEHGLNDIAKQEAVPATDAAKEEEKPVVAQ